jgi:hypothetical protein
MAVVIGQTPALAVAAAVTSSAALLTQTITNLADVAVGGFLLIGVVTGALVVALRPLMRRSRDVGRPASTLLWGGSDPAVTTVVLSSAAGLGGGVVAALGLLGAASTGSS